MKIKSKREKKLVTMALDLLREDHGFCIQGRKNMNPDKTRTNKSVEELKEEIEIIDDLKTRLKHSNI